MRDKVFEDVLSKLVNVERRGDTARASCPCPNHGKGNGDQNQSLSVSIGDTHPVVFHCHVECEPEKIAAALGYEGMHELCIQDNQPSTQRATTSEKSKSAKLGKVVAEYIYHDADGNPVLKVTRTEPKGFYQHGYVGGRWDKDAPKPRVIYKLPEVIAAISEGKTVFIVEGEKDVATLERLGFTATCNAGGANTWKPAHASYLAGADVCILPDNDPPGRKWGDKVGTSLVGVAKSVRALILNVPNLGGDVSDWVKIVSVGIIQDSNDSTADELSRQVDKFSEPWTAGYFVDRQLTGDGLPYPPEVVVPHVGTIVDSGKRHDAPVAKPLPVSIPAHLLDVPGLMGEVAAFINATSYRRQPALALGAAIALQSTLTAQQVKTPTDGRPNLYLLGVGRSGCGKDRARQVLKDILLEATRVGEVITPFDPAVAAKQRTFFFEQVGSYQGIEKRMWHNDGVALLLWDEIGKVLSCVRSDSSAHLQGVIPMLLRMYTTSNNIYTSPVIADVKRQTPDIYMPHLTIYGTTTRKSLESFTLESLSDGLMGRFLIFEADDDAPDTGLERVPQAPKNIIDEARWWIQRRTNTDAGMIWRTPASEIPITDEARSVFEKLAEREEAVNREDDEVKAVLWSRSRAAAEKLALDYSTSRDKENLVINVEAARWATDLTVFLTERKIELANEHLVDSEFDKKQKELLRYIKGCLGGRCTKSQACIKTQRWDKRTRNDVISNLIETGKIVASKDGEGVAATEWYEATNRD